MILIIPTFVFGETYMQFTLVDKGYTGGDIKDKRNRTRVDKFEHQGMEYPNIDENLILAEWEKDGLVMYKLDVSDRIAQRIANSYARFDATVLTDREASGLINNYFHYSGVTK